jgi:endo-1,4-beta-D-glucanase Y
MGTKLLGYILVAAAVIVLLVVVFRNTGKSNVPLVFTPDQILNSTWLNYKTEYLEPTTSRTLDKQNNNITTSEGESYTMLRSVWLGDKTTFDNSWTWTKDNLQHKSGDKLFAWLFGQQSGTTYGIVTAKGGNNTASDADTDIALSLVFAYSRWQEQSYLGDARSIITDIWNNDVVMVNGVPYMAADNLEKSSTNPNIAINVSYFNPAAYRIFAQVDPTHPWNKLVDSSYTLLGGTITSPLNKSKSAGLPPDWISMNRTTGAISAPIGTTNTTNFSYDALRTPWRISLDAAWFKDPRANATLQSLGFLDSQWKAGGSLATTYAHDGSVVTAAESPSMYGGTIGYFINEDPASAATIYQNKLETLYDPGKNSWKDTLSYYDDNWAWFGIALYNNMLPNLTVGLPAGALAK